MVKLGIIVFANDSGLGNQTRRLTYMLNPFRILAINSENFSKNKKQNFDWYKSYQGYKVDGFPRDFEIRKFLEGLTHVLVCENPLNFYLFSRARQLGIKTFCQSNYEFCDNLDKPNLPIPDVFLMPSQWKVGEMREKYGKNTGNNWGKGGDVIHLPPPIDPNEFKEAREINFNRKGKPRFLHLVGTLAAHDRNGTLDLLNCLPQAKGDFDLVIHSQHPLPEEYFNNDNRLSYSLKSFDNINDIYKDFDALILPRRYGGLCLGMNEALMSGLPVLMTDISPNNQILPKKWLIESRRIGEFKARVMIDYYSANSVKMAQKIDWLCQQDFDKLKGQAFEIGYDNFSETVLKSRYMELFR